MPYLTVLMPAKNSAPTIKAAIVSALRAMPRDSELRVWDDGSTDATLDQATSVIDSRLHIHRSETSVGSGRARREMMTASDSTLVSCMDADDVCLPWRFSESALPSDGVDIKFAPMIRFARQARHIRPTRALPLRAEEVPLALLIHNPLAQPTMIAKRQPLDRIGGYSDAKLGQDYELWLRAAASGLRLARLGPYSVAYRVSPTQVTQRPDYRERFTSDVNLRRSYAHLVERVVGDTGYVIADGTDYFNSVRDRILAHLGTFRPSNRSYYRRLLQRNIPLGLEP